MIKTLDYLEILPPGNTTGGSSNNDYVFFQYSSEEEEEDLKKKASALEASKSTAKKLEAVDHSKVVYMPFRKNFYVEVPEIARMSAEGKMLQNINKLVKVCAGNKICC